MWTKNTLGEICTTNYMSGRAIWDKLPEYIFENLGAARVKTRVTSKFSKITRVIYPKNCPNQICDYWLIIQSQQTVCIEASVFLTAGNYKITSLTISIDYLLY